MLVVGLRSAMARPSTFKKCCDSLCSSEKQKCYLQLRQLSGLAEYPNRYHYLQSRQQQQLTRDFSLTLKNFSTTPKYLSDVSPAIQHAEYSHDLYISSATLVKDSMVHVTFTDDSSGEFPYVWMRDNCQCSKCYNIHARARTTLLDHLDVHVKPTSFKVSDETLHVSWSDGHHSEFHASWLKERLFTPEARDQHRTRFHLKRVLWGDNFQPPKMEYSHLFTDDRYLLNFIVNVEKHGIVHLKNCPQEVGPVQNIIDRLGFVKYTHYGYDYNVITKFEAVNMAYTGSKLALHTDQPYYEYPPGVVLLHCVRQHDGPGGDSDLSDGFKAAQLLKENYPEYFYILANTDMYYQDKGFDTYDFDKINRNKSIILDSNGEVKLLFFSTTSRDSFMDLEPEQVIKFYKALTKFNQYLLECSIQLKMESGDMMVMDNNRLMHGRQPFDPAASRGTRHLHASNIDWDEVASKRRVLQDKFNLHLE